MSVRVIVSFYVEDFSKFKTGFHTGAEARSEAGIEAEAYQNTDVPNNAWVILTAQSREDFNLFFSNPVTQERMRNVGIISDPTITFLES